MASRRHQRSSVSESGFLTASPLKPTSRSANAETPLSSPSAKASAHLSSPRLLALDHMRGFGILAVLIFSLWGWLYSSPSPAWMVHNAAGQFHLGDLIFPLFVFCSGFSLWFYVCSQRSRGASLEAAAGHHFRLLLLALLISAMRAFFPFPDEVMFIALGGLLVLPLVWGLGGRGANPPTRIRWFAIPLAYAAVVLALRFLLPLADSPLYHQLASGYLGGFMGLLYYSLLMLAASLLASLAFPAVNPTHLFKPVILRAAALSLPIFGLLSLVDFPDRTALSLSFLILVFSIGAFLLLLFIHLFDEGRRRIWLVEAVGRSSLAGWALFYAVSSLFWHLGLADKLDPNLYLVLCVALYLALGAILLMSRPPLARPNEVFKLNEEP